MVEKIEGAFSKSSNRVTEKTLLIGGIELSRAESTFPAEMSDLSKIRCEFLRGCRTDSMFQNDVLVVNTVHMQSSVVTETINRQTSKASKISHQVGLKGRIIFTILLLN